MSTKDEAQSALRRYLMRFPGERRRMAALKTQLSSGNKRDIFSRKNMTGHITTSAFVIDADAGKVLLIHHKLYDRWLQPGGHYEGRETLWLSALREVGEETGADRAALHNWTMLQDCPFDIDTHAIAAQPQKCEGEHFHHDYVYLVSADSTRPLVPQVEEVFDAKWEPLEIILTLPGVRFKRIARKLVQCAIVNPRDYPAFAPYVPFAS